ncbi:MAG: hypothetical protein WAO00_17340 [Chthoniobacterales bacterium]
MKPEAHSLVVVVCRKRSLLLALPLLGACQLLGLSIAQAATTSPDNTCLSVVTSSLDAIDCMASSETLDEEARQFTDTSPDSPDVCYIDAESPEDEADSTSRFDEVPQHFAGATCHTVPLPPPRRVLRLGGIVLSFSQLLQEIRERGPPTPT